ncbi:hypothetical protein V6667_02100 [Neisseria leonii]|uniref:Secreted protein n=1 Tax=Neisseria leonii TaxID=2995413 RepID=A0A9X4E0P4_9NEIS|nr:MULTISPECIES: hypothetical protein [unclassified Neisseria]MDD9325109.1 hypothetical protein [Neisseria sp. 3986]MDD9327350.1 hypothetical protein [Neisseria sp. 51.81]
MMKPIKILGIAAALILGTSLMPSIHAEAQSADMTAAQLDCAYLAGTAETEMDARQRAYAVRCDAAAADAAWQQTYGGINGQWETATVYE